MIKDSEEDDPPDNNEVIKEEVSLQFHLYILMFAIIYYNSCFIKINEEVEEN
ncbi:MAG: hypothetical protein ACFFA7_17735 [Promethearchaeota archaeon]